jgi:hypothetical protein
MLYASAGSEGRGNPFLFFCQPGKILNCIDHTNYQIFRQTMHPNGPAIKGGCVTWRSIRAVSWYFSRKIVPVQDRYGVLFAIRVQIKLGAGAVAVQVWKVAGNYSRYRKMIDGHWRSVVVQLVSEAEITQGIEF